MFKIVYTLSASVGYTAGSLFRDRIYRTVADARRALNKVCSGGVWNELWRIW